MIAMRAADAYSEETYRIQERNMSATNPFFAASPLPYRAPQFDMIQQEHYRPAFDQGLQQKRGEIAAIAGNPAAADFDNTVLALERSGQLLNQ